MVGWKARQLGDGKQLFNFTLPLSLSLSLPTLSLPSLHLHICPHLMPSLPAEYTMMPFRQLPLRSFKPTRVTHKYTHIHTQSSHTCTNTACSDLDHQAESTFQLFITTLLQHTGAVQRRDRESCRHNNNMMSSCYSAQRFSTNTTNCTSNTTGLETITCHHSVELFLLPFLVPLSLFLFSPSHTNTQTLAA